MFARNRSPIVRGLTRDAMPAGMTRATGCAARAEEDRLHEPVLAQPRRPTADRRAAPARASSPMVLR